MASKSAERAPQVFRGGTHHHERPVGDHLSSRFRGAAGVQVKSILPCAPLPAMVRQLRLDPHRGAAWRFL